MSKDKTDKPANSTKPKASEAVEKTKAALSIQPPSGEDDAIEKSLSKAVRVAELRSAYKIAKEISEDTEDEVPIKKKNNILDNQQEHPIIKLVNSLPEGDRKDFIEKNRDMIERSMGTGSIQTGGILAGLIPKKKDGEHASNPVTDAATLLNVLTERERMSKETSGTEFNNAVGTLGAMMKLFQMQQNNNGSNAQLDKLLTIMEAQQQITNAKFEAMTKMITDRPAQTNTGAEYFDKILQMQRDQLEMQQKNFENQRMRDKEIEEMKISSLVGALDEQKKTMDEMKNQLKHASEPRQYVQQAADSVKQYLDQARQMGWLSSDSPDIEKARIEADKEIQLKKLDLQLQREKEDKERREQEKSDQRLNGVLDIFKNGTAMVLSGKAIDRGADESVNKIMAG